jgi:hypothetical protein
MTNNPFGLVVIDYHTWHHKVERCGIHLHIKGETKEVSVVSAFHVAETIAINNFTMQSLVPSPPPHATVTFERGLQRVWDKIKETMVVVGPDVQPVSFAIDWTKYSSHFTRALYAMALSRYQAWGARGRKCNQNDEEYVPGSASDDSDEADSVSEYAEHTTNRE